MLLPYHVTLYARMFEDVWFFSAFLYQNGSPNDYQGKKHDEITLTVNYYVHIYIYIYYVQSMFP